MTPRLGWVLGLALCSLPAAISCGGDDSGGAGGAGMGGGTHDAGSAAFSDIYDEIVHVRCADTVCHGGGAGGAGKLDFTTKDNAYAALVDVAAAGPDCKSSGKKRVVPGDPAASLLFEKISGTPSCGQRMPLGGMLDADSIARIEAWIANGAVKD